MWEMGFSGKLINNDAYDDGITHLISPIKRAWICLPGMLDYLLDIQILTERFSRLISKLPCFMLHLLDW